MENCDVNGDNELDSCEVHACILECENDWRVNNCPEAGVIECECPFVVVWSDWSNKMI